MNGQLLLEGTFEVLHKEFVAESRICLTLGDLTRRVSIEIPFDVLQEVAPEPTTDSMRAAADRAESRVLERHRL